MTPLARRDSFGQLAPSVPLSQASGTAGTSSEPSEPPPKSGLRHSPGITQPRSLWAGTPGGHVAEDGTYRAGVSSEWHTDPVGPEGGWIDEMMEALGGTAAAAWRRVRAEVRAEEEAQATRNAELDSLPVDEVRLRTIAVLDRTVTLLRGTPLDAELRRHGWSEDFAEGLASECSRLRDCVEDGTYKREWGGAGLGRWVLEEVSPMAGDGDDLHDSIHEAQFMLRAFSRRLPE